VCSAAALFIDELRRQVQLLIPSASRRSSRSPPDDPAQGEERWLLLKCASTSPHLPVRVLFDSTMPSGVSHTRYFMQVWINRRVHPWLCFYKGTLRRLTSQEIQ
jgi:hypothetical protein